MSEQRTVYIVWDGAKTEGYVTFRRDEAEFAAGLIEDHEVDGFYTEGISTIANDWRELFEDCLDELTIETASLPSPPEQGEG